VRDEDIKIVVSDTQAYKIAGNAITVNPMMMLLEQIFLKEKKITKHEIMELF